MWCGSPKVLSRDTQQGLARKMNAHTLLEPNLVARLGTQDFLIFGPGGKGGKGFPVAGFQFPERNETGNPKQETPALAPPASPSFRLPVPSFRFRVTRPRPGTQNHRNKTQPCERSALLMLLTRNSKPETGNDQLVSLSYRPNYCRYNIVCN